MKMDNYIEIEDAVIAAGTFNILAEVKKNQPIEVFKQTADMVYNKNIKSIKEKTQIKIAFLIAYSSMWSCEKLYSMLSENKRYATYIIVSPVGFGSPEFQMEQYQESLNFFIENQYKTIGSYDMGERRELTFEEMGNPDIVMHLYPFYKDFPDNTNILNFPLSVLNAYIPYGIMICGKTKMQFNMMSHMLYWKRFVEDELQKKMTEKYSDIGDWNVMVCGTLKMDELYANAPKKNESIWRISPRAGQNVKKIIYAPHYSIRDHAVMFSTFDYHGQFILKYAKEHENDTSWVIKPHPAMKKGCVDTGFMTEQEYEEYIDSWRKLPNAVVNTSGSYLDIFNTSDAMIFDSVSFLAEYLYVNKPALFLTRPEMSFNDFGERVRKVHYQCEGKDLNSIQLFLDRLLIGQEDEKLAERKAFFEEYLDYYNKNNGKLAAEIIVDYLDQTFSVRKI